MKQYSKKEKTASNHEEHGTVQIDAKVPAQKIKIQNLLLLILKEKK